MYPRTLFSVNWQYETFKIVMPLLQVQSSNDIHNRVGSIGHHFFEESKDIDLLQGSRW